MPIKLEVQRIGHGQDHVAIRHAFIECPPNVGHPLIDVHLAAGEAEAALAAECHPFLFQTVGAQIRGVARLRRATAEHLVNDGLHMTLPVTRMALLEGLPVIAEDLLEGVFVDPLDCGCHSTGLYHVLALRSTRVAPSSDPPSPSFPPGGTGRRGEAQKRKFLDAELSALWADSSHL